VECINIRKKNWEIEHSHTNYEISVVFEGRGVFQYKDNMTSLEPGSFVIIPPNVLHRFYAITPMRFGVIHVENLCQRTEGLIKRLISNENPNVILLSPLDTEQYNLLFRQWLRLISIPLKEEDLFKAAWIELFILFLIEHNRPVNKSISITNVADYIRLNLQEEISISRLAKIIGFSDSGFRRLFKKYYGVTPKQYQQQCRMNEAKWILRSSSEPIQSVADKVGFLNLHGFSSWFQRKEGFSPSEWRKRERDSE
jgi:AraC family transcriptional regulator